MSHSPARRMSIALKRQLVPALKELGFSGTFPRYRRETPNAIELLAVWYDKAATAFFLEFGTHARGDKQTSWGELVPEAKLLLEHVPFNKRIRLQARCSGGSMPRDWFQFGAFGDDEADYNTLAQRVTSHLPQVEAWFRSAEIGPNLRAMGSN